ncbi:MAG: Zn-ribbon containing protein [Halobaculum sp.]
MPHKCTNCGREFPDGSKEMLSGCPDCGSNKFQFEPSGGGSGESVEPASAPETDNDPTPDSPFGEWPDEAKRPEDRDESAASEDAPTASGETPDAPSTSGASGAPETPDASDASSAPTAAGSRASTDRADALDTGDARNETDTPDSDPPHAAETDDTPDTPDSTTADPEGDEVEEDEAQANARTEMVSTDELPETDTGRMPADPTTDPSSTDFDRLREELNDQFESIRIVSPGTYELNLMELYDRQEYIISLREDGRYVIEMPDAWDSPDD